MLIITLYLKSWWDRPKLKTVGKRSLIYETRGLAKENRSLANSSKDSWLD